MQVRYVVLAVLAAAVTLTSIASAAPAQAGTSKIAFFQIAAGGQSHGGLYVMNADGSGKRRLAEAGGIPSWSPDGRKIAFGGRGLQVVNVDGSGLQRLTAGSFPVWSPDGRRIAFTDSFDELYVMNADGTGQRRLITRGGGSYAWSPDWQKIAFRSRQCPSAGTCPSHKFDLYVVNADGSGKRRLASTTLNSTPAWSPDGQQIAYVRRYDIWVMNADGSGQRKLTSTAARELSPAWSPDGRTIAFDRRLGRRGGQGNNPGTATSYEIYVMNADGSGQRRLARGTEPLWSPDGKQIAFRRALGNGAGFPFTPDNPAPANWDIFVMNADGTHQRNLTRDRRWDDCCLAWSPGQK